LIVNESSNLGKAKGQVIESGPSIEKNISGDGSDGVRDRLNFDKIINAIRAGMRLYLAANYVGAGRANIGLDCGIEIIDVLFGPFNLDADKRDSFVSVHK